MNSEKNNSDLLNNMGTWHATTQGAQNSEKRWNHQRKRLNQRMQDAVTKKVLYTSFGNQLKAL